MMPENQLKAIHDVLGELVAIYKSEKENEQAKTEKGELDFLIAPRMLRHIFLHRQLCPGNRLQCIASKRPASTL